MAALLLSGGLAAQAVPAAIARALRSAENASEITFTEHVAPVVFGRCASCHRAGEIAPFPLTTYADVKKRARTVVRATQKRYMPPWHPVPGWGDFRDSRRMSDAEVKLLARWVEGGRKEGPKQALPSLPKFTDGWQLGTPDLVVSMPKGYDVHARGADIYRNFLVPLELDQDYWVRAVEIRPSAPTVLHHSLFWLDDSGAARKAEASAGVPGFRGMGFSRSGSLGGWAVGGMARMLPGGLGYPLPIESDLVLSSHFHPSGKAEREKTTLGLYLTTEPPKRKLLGFMIPPQYGALSGVSIPAGKKDYWVKDSWTVPCDVELVGAGGHAHYICRSMKAVAKLPDGSTKKLFYIADWDFNWQGRYHYEQFVSLPKGTVVDVELLYDNSANNTANPNDPPKRIRWGLQSTDEMGAVIFSCVTKKQADVGVFRRATRQQMRDAARNSAKKWAESIVSEIKEQDANGDGKISKEELSSRYRQFFGRFDGDGNGTLDDSEIQAIADLVGSLGSFGRGRRRR